MIRRKVTSGQTIYDIAIILTGSVDGFAMLLKDNPKISFTQPLVPGTEILFSGTPINKEIVDFYQNQGYNPATYQEVPAPSIYTMDTTLITMDTTLITMDNG